MRRGSGILVLAATLLVLACDDVRSPVHPVRGAPSFSLSAAPAQPWDTGFGTLGAGSPTPGSHRQDFDFAVAADLSGRVFYRDWAALRSDGTVGSLAVAPTDSETAITAYRDWSSACADPTRGAEFDGIGRLNIGALVRFTVRACDNGDAGSGLDLLRMEVLTAPYEYSHGGFLSSGDVVKAGTAILVFQDDFESSTLDPSWREDNPGSNRYETTTRVARSGTRSLQALYAQGNTFGGITRSFQQSYDEVYVRFYVMFEDGFENPGMHFFLLAGDSVDGGQSSFGKAGIRPDHTHVFFYAGLDPEYNPANPDLLFLGPFRFYTYYPGMSCPSDYDPLLENCHGNWFSQSEPKTAPVRGQWQEVVFHLKLNTPGEYDGSQTVWIDGVKKIDVQNVRWRLMHSPRLTRIRFDNWMRKGSLTKAEQHVWVDDVAVWRPCRPGTGLSRPAPGQYASAATGDTASCRISALTAP